MSKNPIFQERKKISKNPIKKIFLQPNSLKKNLKKNLKNFSSKKWLKIFEKKK